MNTKFLRPTASQKQNPNPIEAAVSRDVHAMVLPLTAIKLPMNIRSALDTDGIQELSNSITQHGLLSPLLVSKVEGAFKLIDGHRRYAALQALGKTEASVRILNVTEDEAAVLSLVSNIIRETLAPADEVKAVAKLLPIVNANQSELARMLGKSNSYVNRCVRAAKLLEEHPSCATSHSLTKSILFEAADSKDPAMLESLASNKAPTVREARARSGPLPGGRAIATPIQYRERRGGKAFNLRLSWDSEKTPSADRERMITQLQDIIKKLRDA